MQVIPYAGWQNCARFEFAGNELVVTLDVGPRIIRFGRIGGPNELHENPKQLGLTGGDEYRSYGGHRLWIAPEDPVRTLQPDNDPVEHFERNGYHIFRSNPDKFRVQKEIGIRVQRDAVVLRHRLYNHSAYELWLTPWALTVMAPGGECLVPHAPHQPHSENFLPVRPLVLWSYTRMDDPRWTWGPDLIRLRQTSDGGPQKIGMWVEQGYAAYANHGNLFLKRFDCLPRHEPYADMGCNFETFTRQDMLEVESLGPELFVEPGSHAEHFETWYLIPDATPPSDNAEAANWLAELARKRPLLTDSDAGDWPETLDQSSNTSTL